MKNIVLFTGILLIFIGLVHVFLPQKNASFVEKLLKLYRNIYGDILRNYSNSFYKKCVTMVTMSKMIFILKIGNAHLQALMIRIMYELLRKY